jgi:selenide,water dikinase
LPNEGHRWVDQRTGLLDDAAVVRPEGAARSLLLTMDVVTPIVDDAVAFGAIAAANSLSDIYAMGGEPEVALSFVGLPTEVLGNEIVGEVLEGMHRVCRQARCAIVGGHTMKDSEPKCGLAVVGSVEPEGVWSQRFAQPGDALLLTKPIGTGLVGQAYKKDGAVIEALDEAVAQMMALNDAACRVGRRFGTHACTDVTGFGLLGHLRNLGEASGGSVRLQAEAVPLLAGVTKLAAEGCVPGGTRRNLAYARPLASVAPGIDETMLLVLADAQTSGGLLLCLPAARAAEALAALKDEGVARAAIVGAVLARGEPHIDVV